MQNIALYNFNSTESYLKLYFPFLINVYQRKWSLVKCFLSTPQKLYPDTGKFLTSSSLVLPLVQPPRYSCVRL